MTRHTFVPGYERHGSIPASVSDLHYRLGKLVEHGPGKFIRADNGESISTERRHFEDIPLVGTVNFTTVERLEQHAENARAEMGEERWSALNAEWLA